MARTNSRHGARDFLVRALYQWQFTNHDHAELVDQFEREAGFSAIDQAYFRSLLEIVLEDVETLDGIIAGLAARPLAQLDAVGRAILLLALAELRHRPDVPKNVIINEAVELAKRYGATDSYRFVNALLDNAARELGDRDGRLTE
ncbi:transcription antitermination factor NusB [Candidatus Rariloculus sp.]|uniref:transcription antitermination factor NusB n=1 Tax=Candidatus Rariloculus sp. TaxID=3101265 RepID=UPI003D1090A0